MADHRGNVAKEGSLFLLSYSQTQQNINQNNVYNREFADKPGERSLRTTMQAERDIKKSEAKHE